MNDQADAPVCENIHATKSDSQVAIGSRLTGRPVKNATLVINASCVTQTRDETPSWMEEDLILHGDERAILIGKMAKYLGITDFNENVVEGVMNELVKDNPYYQPYNEDNGRPQYCQDSDPWNRSIKASFKYNGHYFINSPDKYGFGKAEKRRSAQLQSPTTSNSPLTENSQGRKNRSRSVEAPINELSIAEVDVDYDDDLYQVEIPELDNNNNQKPRMSRGNANRQRVHAHPRTFEGVDFEKCDIQHSPQNFNTVFKAYTLAQNPVSTDTVSYEQFQENVIADRIIEVDEVISPDNAPMMRQLRIRTHTFPPGEIHANMETPFGTVFVPNVSRKTIHDLVAPRLKLNSVIFTPPGGGKTTFAYRMSTLGVKVLDTGQITRWRFPPIKYSDPKLQGTLGYDLSQYLIVTNNLNYALNAQNALYVLPCREVYNRRREYKNREFPPYEELKRYIQKQCERKGHTYLLTDLQLGSLPWLINYTSPDYFRVKEIDATFAGINYKWDADEYQSQIT